MSISTTTSVVSIFVAGLTVAHLEAAQTSDTSVPQITVKHDSWVPPPPQRGTCSQIGGNFCVPLDSTYFVPLMNNTSGSGQANPGDPCQRNDDDSGEVALNGWSFDFYGTGWTSLWVNNNGNVSFGQPFSTFSASGFPVAGFPMIAPFWGDVDTRANGGTDGVVWVKEWSVAGGDAVNRLVITWDNVGYYSAQADKLNTFQLILTDGNDPLLGAGNNVCFCYDDMQWTTGSASQGTGGFGGIPATVGANQGNGVDFFQIGRFDQPGTAYDGPGGNPDGVDFLDGAQFCFFTGNAANTPPIFVNPTTQYEVELGQMLQFTIDAIGPETGETVTLTVDASDLMNAMTATTPGNPGSATVDYAPVGIDELGTHVVLITATDDGTPPLNANLEVRILVVPAAVSNPICDPATINSTEQPGRMWGVGSNVAAANSLTLVCADLPQNSNGFFIVSQDQTVVMNPGGSAGDICIASFTIGRYDGFLQNSGVTGTVDLLIDLTQTPQQPVGPVAVLAGETWNWQYWYRDTDGMGGATSNFTNAISVLFQ